MEYKKGFTLIDAIVGTSLILIVFLGIFAAYQLGLRVVGQSKNKIIATAIANQEVEKIRSLSYGSIGTIGAGLPLAEGTLEASTTTVRNGVEYTINRTVEYISDTADDPEAACILDYKKLEIQVSWSGRFSGNVKLATDAVPKNKAEENAACLAQPGGIISVEVFDAYGIKVPLPLIEIIDPLTETVLKSNTPAGGIYDFPLATSTYRVAVSKSGYSSEQTYGSGEIYNGQTIITPEKSNPIVLENQITPISFSIDKVSSFFVDTFSLWGSGNFSDSFFDASRISEFSDVIIGGGNATLATTSSGYLPSGYLISTSTSPASIIEWNEFSWSDTEPLNTDLKYQIFYATSSVWQIIPDADLSGNSNGFNLSPVDLSALDIVAYPKLKSKAIFSTNSASSTPLLYDWQISWKTSQATPIPNADFDLRGNKVVGTDSGGDSIYKYSTSTTSDSGGHKDISNLEWDSYTFSVDSATNLDLVSIDPSPQPISLSPDTALMPIKLYLKAQNSLLVTIQNSATADPVFAAGVRLYNAALGYDTTQYTDANGQTYFIPLDQDTYNLEISASGYSATSTAVSVSGDVVKILSLEQIE